MSRPTDFFENYIHSVWLAYGYRFILLSNWKIRKIGLVHKINNLMKLHVNTLDVESTNLAGFLEVEAEAKCAPDDDITEPAISIIGKCEWMCAFVFLFVCLNVAFNIPDSFTSPYFSVAFVVDFVFYEKWLKLFIGFILLRSAQSFWKCRKENNKNDLFSRHLVQFTVVRCYNRSWWWCFLSSTFYLPFHLLPIQKTSLTLSPISLFFPLICSFKRDLLFIAKFDCVCVCVFVYHQYFVMTFRSLSAIFLCWIWYSPDNSTI